MHGQINSHPRTVSQARTRRPAEKHFANETAGQRFDHFEIALRYRPAQSEGIHPKIYSPYSGELERSFVFWYGAVLPNDDAGAHDIFVMAHHLAHLDDPDKRIRAWIERQGTLHSCNPHRALIAQGVAQAAEMER